MHVGMIVDLHEDISSHIMSRGYRDFGEDIEGRHADIPKYRRAGVRLVFAALFPGVSVWDPRLIESLRRGYGSWGHGKAYAFRGGYSLVLAHLRAYYGLVKAHPQEFTLVESDADLESVKGGRIGLLLALEGADPLEDPWDLEILYRLGVRSLAITWNYGNRYAASCMSSRDYGLTGEGEELVRAANELGVILDVSHASRQAALDVAGASRLPVIASHSNYSGIHEHRRNVDDEVIEAIKSTGGVIGFTMIANTIGKEASMEKLADHIMAVWERFGPEVLAIGTDYFGITETPKGLEDISRLPRLLEELAKRGMGDPDLRKLAWENAWRVIEAHASRWKHV